MTDRKGDIYSAHRSLETGRVAYHTTPYKATRGGARMVLEAEGRNSGSRCGHSSMGRNALGR